ncbi:MAG: DUF3656 domain-containing protein, partial [Lachnospiraceae bacterium]|nr:DUF3656 domain-containing protein [Lachnospiraceae bacterium]
VDNLRNLYTRGDMETGYYERHNGRSMVTLTGGSYQNATSDFGRQVKEQYLDVHSKIPLEGKVTLQKGKPARLSLRCLNPISGSLSEEVSLETVLNAAINRPMSEADVRKQLDKMGNTLFRWDTLTIEMEPDIFIPNRELNELRRLALDTLSGRMLAPYKRVYQKFGSKDGDNGTAGAIQTRIEAGCEANGEQIRMPGKRHRLDNVRFAVSVMQKAQFDAALARVTELPIGRIYLPFRLYRQLRDGRIWEPERLRERGVSCYLSFPPVIRYRDQQEIEAFLDACKGDDVTPVDGFLINSLELFAFFKQREDTFLSDIKMQADFGLYAFGSRAYHFLREIGFDGVTGPLEWSRHEWKDFRRICPDAEAEMLVYGHLPLMESAGCICKTMNVCKKNTGEAAYFLKDRYNKIFPVLTDCVSCHNTILNSVPLSLHKEWEQLREFSDSFRLRFTIEDYRQTDQLLMQFASLFSEGEMRSLPQEYTTGHFRKGVL